MFALLHTQTGYASRLYLHLFRKNVIFIFQVPVSNPLTLCACRADKDAAGNALLTAATAADAAEPSRTSATMERRSAAPMVIYASALWPPCPVTACGPLT